MIAYTAENWLYEADTVVGMNQTNQVLPTMEFYECTLQKSSLNGCTLTRWLFEDCVFEECDLSNINLGDSTFQRCTFIGSRLMGIDWSTASQLGFNVIFKDCDLRFCSFAGRVLKNFECVGCQCSDVDFTNADLTGVNFSRTKLANAIFQNTILVNGNLSTAIELSLDPQANRLRNTSVSSSTALEMAKSLGIVVTN